ncbi:MULTISPECIES: porin [unclassified Candidatus Frackibacter]|uniref:porin n=1 Tax=unclassified Candidatus Frackibacter TaxID=2648818 RepID=UPI000880AF4E|nr:MULTISPECIES: porin [unclassified Candidatus Frackibacter]SDC08546.1 hypothetical protein SAMN04515661_10249 [Candidatus Frackibacter sp. WG11]SEM38243.1 hypothetical protein SAMN04488698_102162 [Candidatus Frackibacter sp. WG12]SFL43807.1 hypothetical protein SAMN04488699_102162 [Candidatus Frackibacter sp. WG13]
MKKFSIVLTLALVVALAVPAMAAPKLAINGNLEMENSTVDKGGPTLSSTYGDLDLYLNAKINDKVSAFTELDYDTFFVDNVNDTGEHQGRVDQMWINVEDAFGPLALRVGRMDEAAASNLLYDIEDKANEFVRFAYNENNVSGKVAYNLDNNDSKKVLLAEGKVTDLGLVDGVTVNYFDANTLDYEGYTLKATKQHSFGTGSIVFGEADNGPISGAQVLDVDFTTKTLFPGVTAGLEYGTVDKGFVLNNDTAIQDDSVFNDVNADYEPIYSADDVQVIKPSVSFDLTDKLGVYFGYAMYEGDKSNAKQDYLDLVASYDLAPDTYLDVEYENFSNDWTGAPDDESALTTTLGVNF